MFYNPLFHRDWNSPEELAIIRRKLPPAERPGVADPAERTNPRSKRLETEQKDIDVDPSQPAKAQKPKTDYKALPSGKRKRPSFPTKKTRCRTKEKKKSSSSPKGLLGATHVCSSSGGGRGQGGDKSLLSWESYNISSDISNSAPLVPNGSSMSEPDMGRVQRINDENPLNCFLMMPHNPVLTASSSKKPWGKKELLAKKNPYRAKPRAAKTRRAFTNVSNRQPPKTPKRSSTEEKIEYQETFFGPAKMLRPSNPSGALPLLHPFAVPDWNFASPTKFETYQAFMEFSPFLKEVDTGFISMVPQAPAHPPQPLQTDDIRPNAVQLSFRGSPAQFSPMQPFPSMTRRVSTVDEQVSGMTPNVQSEDETPVIRNPRNSCMTEGVPIGAAVVSQGKSEIDAGETPSKRSFFHTSSPSCFVPVSVTGLSSPFQSPFMKHFLGLTSELNQALDLNDCLEDCKQAAL
jgi:hypothetical protein